MYNYRIYKNRLQSMYNYIVGRAASAVSPFFFLLLEFSHWLFLWFAVQFLQATLWLVEFYGYQIKDYIYLQINKRGNKALLSTILKFLAMI